MHCDLNTQTNKVCSDRLNCSWPMSIVHLEGGGDGIFNFPQ